MARLKADAGGVDWATLKDQVQTAYVVLPPDKLRTYHRYARAVLGLAPRS